MNFIVRTHSNYSTWTSLELPAKSITHAFTKNRAIIARTSASSPVNTSAGGCELAVEISGTKPIPIVAPVPSLH
ncbi:hypothetical protein FHG87_003855 [Trinorchestia longiramus]|nr:hypothetical protein FHG87_003855 [Trinorchestia longiramus]